MNQGKTQRYNNPFSATLAGISDLFKRQIPSGVLKPEDRLDGKVVLVDGASSGLGFAIAADAARRGAKVIMACRSGIPFKGEEVKRLSGSSEVSMLPVDFSDIHSIHHLAEELRKVAPVDIYICNAGIVPAKSRKTKEGFEEMFMVNYLSKFIFINLLLEKKILRIDDPSRIIIISSESHRNPEKIEWKKFGVYEDYSMGKSVELYGYYKLLLTTFAAELSRKIQKQNLRTDVFALCPGPVNSNIAREAPKLFHPLLRLIFTIFFKSPAKAAEPVIYLAASPEMEGKKFDYFFLMTRREIDRKALDEENGKMLWELSEKIIKNPPY